MIRRVVEYVVCCDGDDRNGEPCYESTAYGSSTADDCAEQAEGSGWTRKNKRHWLCPYCTKRQQDARE
jgi:hypothetical protein